MNAETTLSVSKLDVVYRSHGRRTVRAVQDVSFEIPSGQTYALVGESGSGKSSVANAVLRLVPSSGGEIRLGTALVDTLNRRDFTKRVQAVFQDPSSSLNPRMTVAEIVSEPLRAHGMRDTNQRAARVAELLDLVGLPRGAESRRPHQFSGGQRQRVAIARSLVVRR